ncbi:MAG: hypothetical protein HYY84_16790 [Deltaproteobacteria bacterium]|nr:hypothetical protein [Deltaproteobacteria bacterium]
MRSRRRIPESIELVVRPGAVFARIVAAPAPAIAIFAAYALPLTVLAAFFSFSYVGAVTLGHFAANFIAYAVFFGIQAVLVAGIARFFLRRPARPLVRAFALTYFPYELFYTALLGLFVVAPDPYELIAPLIFSFALPGALGATFIASSVLTYVMFREAAPGRRRLVALAATLAYAFGFAGLVTLYISAFSLWPLPAGAP